MPRERKPSSKLQFLQQHEADWQKKQAATEAGAPARRAALKEKKREKREKERAAEKEQRRKEREKIQAKKRAARAREQQRKQKLRERQRAAAQLKRQAKAQRARASNGVKRALSAYMFFAQEVRQEVKDRYPTATFGEVGRILGEWWGDLEDDERAKYDAMHAADVQRYQAQGGAAAAKPRRVKAPKAKKAPKPKPKPKPKKKKKKVLGGEGGKYHCLARDAIIALKERGGSSQMAIERYVLDTHPDVDIVGNRYLLRNALKAATSKGHFIRNKNSWKINKNPGAPAVQ